MHTTMSAVLGLLVLQSVLAAAETGTGQETANIAIQTTNKVGITTKSGITYTNCTISRVEPNGITVFHAVGIAKIPFTDLPEELQAKYNYNQTNAAAYTRAVNQKQTEAWARQQEEVKRQKGEAEFRQATQGLVKTTAKQGIPVAGKVLQVTDEGVLLSSSVTLDERVEVDPTDRVKHIDGPRMRKVTGLKNVTAEYEPIFIVGIGSELHDGAQWAGAVYPAGNHQYTSVQGATKTVKRFATTPERAVDLQLNK